MCWIGKGPAKIAERDIVVYKLGYVIEATKEFRSLYQNYTYYPKGLNKVVTLVPVVFTTKVSKLQPSETGMIYEGYHSYSSVNFVFDSVVEGIFGGYVKTIQCGNRKEIFRVDNSLYLATFIIPVGSVYFINEEGVIVSNKIRYTGKYIKL